MSHSWLRYAYSVWDLGTEPRTDVEADTGVIQNSKWYLLYNLLFTHPFFPAAADLNVGGKVKQTPIWPVLSSDSEDGIEGKTDGHEDGGQLPVLVDIFLK